MGWEDWCALCPSDAGKELAQPGYWGTLNDLSPAHLSVELSRLGLHSDQPILVYADGPASKGREARIAWMLLYWGASQVWLLDGGWRAWLGQGGRVESTLPAPSAGRFQVSFQQRRRIHHHQLRQLYQRGEISLLVDLRSRAEYDGELYDYQPRLGHIPTAFHLPYTALFDDHGYFLSKESYLGLLPAEIQTGKLLIPYCEVGVRSCLFALLHEFYTGQIVPNYDGSFMQWALDEDLPVWIT